VYFLIVLNGNYVYHTWVFHEAASYEFSIELELCVFVLKRKHFDSVHFAMLQSVIHNSC